MIRTVRTASVIATILLLLVSGSALAAPPPQGGNAQGGQGYGPGGPGGPGHRGAGPLAGILRQLDLTDQQRDQARDIVRQHMDGTLGDLMRDHFETRQAIRRLVVDPDATDDAIAAAVQAHTATAEQLAIEQHSLTKDLFAILTDEQRQQAKSLLAELPDDWAPRRHWRGRGGPPSGE